MRPKLTLPPPPPGFNKFDTRKIKDRHPFDANRRATCVLIWELYECMKEGLKLESGFKTAAYHRVAAKLAEQGFSLFGFIRFNADDAKERTSVVKEKFELYSYIVNRTGIVDNHTGFIALPESTWLLLEEQKGREKVSWFRSNGMPLPDLCGQIWKDVIATGAGASDPLLPNAGTLNGVEDDIMAEQMATRSLRLPDDEWELCETHEDSSSDSMSSMYHPYRSRLNTPAKVANGEDDNAAAAVGILDGVKGDNMAEQMATQTQEPPADDTVLSRTQRPSPSQHDISQSNTPANVANGEDDNAAAADDDDEESLPNVMELLAGSSAGFSR